MPRLIHCILHNVIYDQRLHKMALSTMELGDTEVVGITAPGKKGGLESRPYRVRRLWVPVRGGPLYFLLANLRLFFHLLFKLEWEAVIANDLAALPGTWLAARLRRKVLLLDSRELFTQTPFLIHRPVVRKIWETLERFLYPRVRYIITVSPPIAEYFQRKYSRNVWLVYNLPLRRCGFARPRLENRLLLYQGMLHPHRGLEELILSLSYAEDWKLWIAGDGPLRRHLEKLVKQQHLEGRVRFLGMVPFEVLEGYTRQATLGVCGELPHGLNHSYALPNKLFDYLQQGIPVLAGEAPLIQRIVRYYGCGTIVDSWKPRVIADALQRVAASPRSYDCWIEGAQRAAKALYWERQIPCIRRWIRYALEGASLPQQEAVETCCDIVKLTQILRESPSD
ncbi:MAG: glycosyltransferase [Bacteroidia bacterium]|nr:glycosyltransferase [Bacteroidia bacterium]